MYYAWVFLGLRSPPELHALIGLLVLPHVSVQPCNARVPR